MPNTTSYAFFLVLCIHICAVLQKDPSKFHMSLEFARVLLDRGVDMEAQDDDDKRTPLLLGLRD
jgi:hypothetical protein